MLIEEIEANSRDDTLAVGQNLAHRLKATDTVLCVGELGAGKTTLIRGVISALGYEGSVKSPTFNLIQLYSARVPIMHADLYRLKSGAGIGLEDYLEKILCLIEWPDRLGGLVSPEDCWQIQISFLGDGRLIQIQEPSF